MFIWTKNEATPSFRQIFLSIWSTLPNNPRGWEKKGLLFFTPLKFLITVAYHFLNIFSYIKHMSDALMHLLEVQVQEENHMLNIFDHNVLHYGKLKATSVLKSELRSPISIQTKITLI